MDIKFFWVYWEKNEKRHKKNGMSLAAATQNLLMESEEREIIEGV
jgi:hypothetical protein